MPDPRVSAGSRIPGWVAPSLCALCGLVLVACGGSSTRGTTAAAPAEEAPPAAAAPGADEPSGIPGLSVADVAAMPPAPPLPSGMDHTTTREEVEAAALRQAERELTREAETFADIDRDDRVAFLTHHWWQEVRTLQRGQPSDIPGLTVGEVEDQPAVPPLPRLFDVEHGPEDLADHAVILALEEHKAGQLGPELSVEARTIYLVWAWTPLLQQRQARHLAAIADRDAYFQRQLAAARHRAEWRQRIQDQREAIAWEIWLAQLEVNPVLTEEQRDELESLGAAD